MNNNQNTNRPANRRTSALLIGLTGNICSGKSTVLRLFAELGCKTISTDEIASDLITFDKNIREQILKEFGTIDRNRLADIIFAEAGRRQLLEKIIHPKITKIAEKKFESLSSTSTAVIEVPLLFEVGWEEKVDVTVLVTCPKEIRKKRFYSQPNVKPGDFERREATQWPEEKKADLANYKIDNSDDLKTTRQETEEALRQIRS